MAFDPPQTTSPVTISGLQNGTSYTVTLRALNARGAGEATEPATATPAALPGAPTGLIGTPADGSITVAFEAGSNGGATISNYEYSLNGGDYLPLNPADGTSPVTITGLTNGTEYSIRLRGVNTSGAGTPSAPVVVTPIALPGSPVEITFASEAGALIVSFEIEQLASNPATAFEYSLDDGETWIPIDLSTLSATLLSGSLGDQAVGDVEALFLSRISFRIPILALDTAKTILVRALNFLGIGGQSAPTPLPPILSVKMRDVGPKAPGELSVILCRDVAMTDCLEEQPFVGTGHVATFTTILPDGVYRYRVSNQPSFTGAQLEWWGDGSATMSGSPITSQFDRSTPSNESLVISRPGCYVFGTIANWTAGTRISLQAQSKASPLPTPMTAERVPLTRTASFFLPTSGFATYPGELDVGAITLSVSPTSGAAPLVTDQTPGTTTCDPSSSLRVRNVGGGSAAPGVEVTLDISTTDSVWETLTTDLAEGPFGLVTFDRLLADGVYQYRVVTRPTSPAAVQPEWWGDGSFTISGAPGYFEFTRKTPYFNGGATVSGCTVTFTVGNASGIGATTRFTMLVWQGDYNTATAIQIDRTLAPPYSGISMIPTKTELATTITNNDPFTFFFFLSDITVPGHATDQPGVHHTCSAGKPGLPD